MGSGGNVAEKPGFTLRGYMFTEGRGERAEGMALEEGKNYQRRQWKDVVMRQLSLQLMMIIIIKMMLNAWLEASSRCPLSKRQAIQNAIQKLHSEMSSKTPSSKNAPAPPKVLAVRPGIGKKGCCACMSVVEQKFLNDVSVSVCVCRAAGWL